MVVGSGIKEGGKETLDRLQLVSQTHDTVSQQGLPSSRKRGQTGRQGSGDALA